MARACNYHLQAIRHIRHLLTTELAHWRAVWYCLDWTTATLCCMELQRAVFRIRRAAARAEHCSTDRPPSTATDACSATTLTFTLATGSPADRLQAGRANWTYKVRSTGTPSYLSPNQGYLHVIYALHRTSLSHAWPTVGRSALHADRSVAALQASHLLLQKPTTRTHFGFADRAFRCTARCTYCLELSEQLTYTVDSGSLAVFKSRLKTFLFRRTFNPV